MLVADGAADKWLVDPPREGAFALVKALADLHQQRMGIAPDVEEGKAAPGWPICLPGHRPSALSTSAATPPRWRATRACWCTKRATAAQRRAW